MNCGRERHEYTLTYSSVLTPKKKSQKKKKKRDEGTRETSTKGRQQHDQHDSSTHSLCRLHVLSQGRIRTLKEKPKRQRPLPEGSPAGTAGPSTRPHAGAGAGVDKYPRSGTDPLAVIHTQRRTTNVFSSHICR